MHSTRTVGIIPLPAEPPSSSSRSRFHYRLGIVLVASVALLLREWFVLVTQVESPIRGDIVQYMAYAWNLIEHQTFSMTHVPAGAPIPDSFRGPGYPLFLALALGPAGGDGPWYPLALQLQVAVSTLTCVLTVVCARNFMPAGFAVLCGLILAVWPHHIAATGALLTEVVFGFSLMAALWLNMRALRTASRTWAMGAGLVYGYAFLVNPLALPLALLSGAISLAYVRRIYLIWIAVIPLLFALAWQTRNALVVAAEHAPPNRGLINLVEGSWPLYHAAYNSRHMHEEPARIMKAIVEEERLIVRDLGAGLAAMGKRMSESPVDYLRWYIFDKPWLLWDWDVRIGAGDIYFHEVKHSPLETQPALALLKRSAKVVNPVLFGLCLAAVASMLIGVARTRRPPNPAAALVACSFVWFTAVHALLQAEPRYAVAYRPIEMMLCMAPLAGLLSWRIRNRS